MILFAKQKQRHDIENKCMDTKGERVGGGMNWEIGIDIYTLLILCIKQITNENIQYIAQGTQYLRFCGDLNGKEIQVRGDIRIHIADSLCCTAETNTTL